jgi:PAS domain S-box-containing protein
MGLALLALGLLSTVLLAATLDGRPSQQDRLQAATRLVGSLTLLMSGFGYALWRRDANGARRVEAALLAAEARERARRAELETILDAVPAAILIARDADCRAVTINRRAAELFRVPPSSSLASAAAEGSFRILPDGAAACGDEALREAATRGVELRNVRQDVVIADGGVRRLVGNVSPLRDDSGRPQGAVAAFVDTTETVQAEAEIRRLSTALEQSPVSIVITDLDGTIEYVNRKFTEVSGYARHEVIGRNPRILKSGRLSAESYRELWATITAGGEWRGELQNCAKDGTLFWERAVISPISNEAGRITHFLAVKEDISERKAAEQTLRDTQGQLAQAQKMEAIGLLAGGIAHDFNNLLGVIAGYCELVLRELGEEDPRRRRLLEIRKAAERATGLTRQLLAFSRKQVMQPRVIDLNVVVSDMSKMLRRLIGEDVELLALAGNGLGMVRADPGQMEQVLLNLALNARDAMPRGGKLTIETANVTLDGAQADMRPGVTPGRHVMLAVSDTGHGMNRDVQARVFEPFFTTKGQGKGTGLGLSTVYGIVKQSGGSIWVYSEEGVGTSFKVYLPRIEASAEVAEPEPPRARRGGSETILLVEDDASLRELVAEVLGDLGYTVLAAAHPEEALDLVARGTRLDLLLTDVVMPGIGGRELARRIEASVPGLKVLYASGYTADAILRHGILADGLAFLQKPFTADVLALKVREVLEGKG